MRSRHCLKRKKEREEREKDENLDGAGKKKSQLPTYAFELSSCRKTAQDVHADLPRRKGGGGEVGEG